MAFQGALGLGAAKALGPDCFSCSSQLTVRVSRHSGTNARVAFPRSAFAIGKNGAPFGSFSELPVGRERRISGNFLCRERSVLVRAEAGPESEFRPQGKQSSPVDPETGIDADGFVTASLPEEFIELMKDDGDPPNYGLFAFGVVTAILARGVIWREIQNWVNIAAFLAVFALESVQALAYKLVDLGGQPVLTVLEVFLFVGQNIVNVFRLAGELISVREVSLAILLSTVVLLVGESVSETYKDASEFPSRNMLDFAGVLGLAAAVGFISAEFMLLGLVGITSYLLSAKRYNPVAGFTPAVATLVAIAGPAIRWPIFAAFVGSSVFRYWKKGYLSQGAVMNTRRGQHPRVLVGLVYLVGISMVSKVIFYFEALFPSSPPTVE
ncbi:hypothetical protein MPTK1_2g01060 [Marchantia polymorpha subsp. ruderalis]|uniref:Uncharacterized protein n=2 Tax=Marchantia polymorpha TaxID=3197 RepID=A0A176W5P0_MARPO|nr:hypothetical protein AXG93_2490s1190 [Marchantia polymorpha subsp. ruderalis]PTQ42725.1 hypothetical protein MARPO_0028s0045 [Marchantia polymorpha]BBN00671.1 hypothetical protein Mp_2g01060 [Marchantia polymorpha subsp. ruderalis]|eukprot:PTQ42725.1 hypothetical protein MARPO_0028s0045 [Marchantia polymorpha]